MIVVDLAGPLGCDENKRVAGTTDLFEEVVEALEATNESVLSHRVNDVLRLLTTFSVMLLSLTLVASIWGMNVHVPGEGDIGGFFAVIGVMLVVLVTMVTWFRRRGWLRE